MIKRIINLNKFRNKFGINSELVSEEVNKFKGIPKDFKITSAETIFSLTGLPLSDVFFNDEGAFSAWTPDVRILRYRTMIDNRIWLKNFIKKTNFYKLCKRKGENKWISIKKDFFDFNGEGYAELPFAEGEIGTEIFVNSDILEFNKRFNNLDGAKAFNGFVKLQYEDNPHTATTVSYITLPILIDNDYDDLGELQTDIKFWQKGKKYHLYDTIIGDNGNVWSLVSGSTEGNKVKYDKIEAPRQIAELIRISGATWDEKKLIDNIDSINNFENFILREGEKFYFIYPYNDSNFNKEEWKEILPEDGEGEHSAITGATIGYVKTLKRYKSEAIDYKGNSYPFILSDGGTSSEISYIPGIPLNMQKIRDNFFCDVITEIKFEDKSFTGGTISCNSIVDAEGSVTFTYLKNSCYDSKDTVQKFKGGVKYIEEYPYHKKSIIFKESETESGTPIEYVDIDYSFQNANFKYDVNLVNEDFLSGITSYRNESLIGIVDINKDVNVNIERGKSAAFERHNILGEINSFEELQNYKNDYFKIRKNS